MFNFHVFMMFVQTAKIHFFLRHRYKLFHVISTEADRRSGKISQKDISVISRHIKNIYKEGELEEESNLHFLQIPFSDIPSRLYDLVNPV